MIEVKELKKYFNNRLALNGVDFQLNKGKIVGLLGPNGAGKTTTMRIMTGFLDPSYGDVVYDGISIIDNPREIKNRLGYLPENAPLYSDFLVGEYLKFISESRGIPKSKIKNSISRVLNLCTLESKYYIPINQLSKGFHQRVAIAGTLIHDPDYIILDEPSTGLDPNQITDIRKLIKYLGKDKTIILSTHILQEVVEVCDRVIILSNGVKVLDSLVVDIINNDYVFISTRSESAHVCSLLIEKGFNKIQLLNEHEDGYKDYLIDSPNGGSSEVFRSLSKNFEDMDVRTITPYQRSLESIFNELTQGEKNL